MDLGLDLCTPFRELQRSALAALAADVGGAGLRPGQVVTPSDGGLEGRPAPFSNKG
jgi:hypothetical protein